MCIQLSLGFGICTQIWRGELVQAFNSLLQAGLLFIIWVLSKRIERMALIISSLSTELTKNEDFKRYILALNDIVDKREKEEKDETETKES